MGVEVCKNVYDVDWRRSKHVEVYGRIYVKTYLGRLP